VGGLRLAGALRAAVGGITRCCMHANPRTAPLPPPMPAPTTGAAAALAGGPAAARQ
jgi:hypothetical protein